VDRYWIHYDCSWANFGQLVVSVEHLFLFRRQHTLDLDRYYLAAVAGDHYQRVCQHNPVGGVDDQVLVKLAQTQNPACAILLYVC
jgi:hypothetical protein